MTDETAGPLESIKQILDDLSERYVAEGRALELIQEIVDTSAARPPDSDCVEYILEDGRRFAWSESNVHYEEVPENGASFTLLRSRLTQAEDALRGLSGQCLMWLPEDSHLYEVAQRARRLV